MNVCPRLRMVGSAGSDRGQGRARSRHPATNRSPRNPFFVNVPSLLRKTYARDPVCHALAITSRCSFQTMKLKLKRNTCLNFYFILRDLGQARHKRKIHEQSWPQTSIETEC